MTDTVSFGTVVLNLAEPPSNPGYMDLLRSGEWEPHTIAALQRLLGPGETMLEIGAWNGLTALVGAATGATVHSYEPDPKALQMFRTNMELNPKLAERVTLHPQAVARRRGHMTISNATLGDSTSSLLKRTGDHATIDAVSVADVRRAPWFDSVTLVKLDVEGGEYPIAGSLGRALAARRPYLLLSTHVDYLSDLGSSLPHRLRRVLRDIRRARHTALIAELRAYRYWHVPNDSWWRPISSWEVASRLYEYKNQEFLLASSPL